MKEEVTAVEIIKSVKGKTNELKKALIEITPPSRAAKGCLQYELFDPITTEDEFLILMRWASVEDLRKHEESEYIADFVKKYDHVLYSDAVVTEWKKP